MDTERVNEIRAALRTAVQELNALCNGQPFRMRIPVQDTDSDQIIGKALHNIGELIDENARLQAVADAARALVALDTFHMYDLRTMAAYDELKAKLAAYEQGETPAT